MLETQRNLELVRCVNARFYEALEARDLEKMAAVWDHAGDICCIHPGWELLRGWESVRDGFEAIFQGPEALRITLTEPRIRIHGSLAVLCVVENMLSDARGNVGLYELQATNIFRRLDGRWKMIHHHASPFVRRMSAPPLSLN